MTSYLLNELLRRLYDRGVKKFAPWRQLFSCGFFGNLLKMGFERRNIVSFSKNFVIQHFNSFGQMVVGPRECS